MAQRGERRCQEARADVRGHEKMSELLLLQSEVGGWTSHQVDGYNVRATQPAVPSRSASPRSVTQNPVAFQSQGWRQPKMAMTAESRSRRGGSAGDDGERTGLRRVAVVVMGSWGRERESKQAEQSKAKQSRAKQPVRLASDQAQLGQDGVGSNSNSNRPPILVQEALRCTALYCGPMSLWYSTLYAGTVAGAVVVADTVQAGS